MTMAVVLVVTVEAEAVAAVMGAEAVTGDPLLKAWSVAMFLIETNPDDARRFFHDAGEEKGRKKGGTERILSRYFREFKTWKDLDAAWRAWALDVYRK